MTDQEQPETPQPEIEQPESQLGRKKQTHLIMEMLSEQAPSARVQIYIALRLMGFDLIHGYALEAQEIATKGVMLTPAGIPRTTGGIFFQILKRELPDDIQKQIWPERFQQKHKQPKPAPTPQPAPPPTPPSPAAMQLAQMISVQLGGMSEDEQIAIGRTVDEHGAEAAVTALRRALKARSITPDRPALDLWREALEVITPTPFPVPSTATKGTTVKITLVGRPEKVEEKPGQVILFMTVNKIPSAFPKGVPQPPAVPTRYRVFVGSKQWTKAKVVMDQAEDAAIIEGFGMLDPTFPGISVYATSVKSRMAEQTAKAEQQGKIIEQGSEAPS